MLSIKRIAAAIVSLAVTIGSADVTASASEPYKPNIGIWYSTWYANQGHYFWSDGFGANSVGQFLADADGDGLDDAIVFQADGIWKVAKSDGTKFGPESVWVAGHGVGSTKQFVADVTGDGKADSVIFYKGDGSWYIAPSTGNGFGAYFQLRSGFGTGADDAFIADVDGDGKADAIVYNNTTFTWEVALSTGNAFGAGSEWLAGFGANASRMMADVDGDGKADAVSMYDGDGSWWVAISNGSGFNAYSLWISGYGSWSSRQMLADKNNDGKADAITFYTNGPTGGDWQARVSDGSSFVAEPYPYSGEWKYKHGVGSTWQGMGKVFGPAYPGAAPVAFDGNTGKWKVIPSGNDYLKPNTWNTWESGLNAESREIKYRPKTAGVYGMYDSGDPAVIDEHIQMLANAKIDFIILDMTNSIDADNKYIINRAVAVMERLAAWNANPSNRKVKYAFAVGFIQFNHNPQSFENEAKVVLEQYVNHGTYGGSDNYYYEDGKPLIVSFSSYEDRIAIENWTGDKTYQNQFTIKYAQGRVPEFGNPPVEESGLYYGWVATNGAVPHPDAMLVNPGHNPNIGVSVISRVLDGVNGGFYERSWDRVIAQKPKTVIIGSFNEFAEENAIQPADTSRLIAPSEKWYNKSGQLDADFYWNMTVQKINELLGEPTRAFAVAGELEPGAKIAVTVTVSPINGINHSGAEVIVFQLMNGPKPVSLVALQQDITAGETFTAHFNVVKKPRHTVKVYILNDFNSNPLDDGSSLAEVLILQ
ncbi:FG-GAP-like repeat-containing protein [Cohnella sp.]|uniref:FG-GAP-like repeat-containing protein n=1 Tax=Cohnella sp. TaxID=1883426 RepID=UPI00356AF2AC